MLGGEIVEWYSPTRSEPDKSMSADLFSQLRGTQGNQFKDVVEGLLRLRLRDLRLPPEIMAAYQDGTRGRTRAMMASWCLWIASMDFVLAGFDFFILRGQVLWLVLATRVLIIGGFSASSLLLRQKKLAGREHYAIILPSIAGILCAGGAGQAVAQPIVQFDYLVTAMLMMATGIIFLNIDLRTARLLTITGTISIGVLTLLLHPTGLAIRLQLLCLFNGTMMALYQARKIMILYQHRLFLLTLRDEIISAETANANAQLSSIAYIDQLTDIPNRRYFEEICAAMSESTKHLLPLSICMIDIDYFKKVNDTLGHLRGDHCLRVIANTIRHNLRGKTDILIRYGGEEFLLMLPGTDIDRAAEIAERVRAAIAGLGHENPGSPFGIVTVSVGIAMVAGHPVDIEALIQRADNGLYRAKSAGRNKVSV
jgi:diguanylate cyclase (GGDEF)-like protein